MDGALTFVGVVHRGVLAFGAHLGQIEDGLRAAFAKDAAFARVRGLVANDLVRGRLHLNCLRHLLIPFFAGSMLRVYTLVFAHAIIFLYFISVG